MGLKADITEGMKAAMKGGDKLRLSTLRMLLSAVKNREIDKKGELTDEEVHAVAKTLAKQRREAIEQYRKGGRDELARKEAAELEVVEEFLPEQLSAEEVRKVVEETAREVGAAGPADMGRLMKAAMEKLKGRADGRAVQEAAKALLSG